MKRTLVTTLLDGTALMLGSAAGSTAAPSHSSGVGLQRARRKDLRVLVVQS